MDVLRLHATLFCKTRHGFRCWQHLSYQRTTVVVCPAFVYSVTAGRTITGPPSRLCSSLSVCVCDSLIYDRFICCCGRRAERGKCSRPDGGSTPSRSVSRLDRGGRGGGAPTSSPSRKSSPTCLTWSRQTARRPADSTLPRARPRRALTADKSNYISARKFAAFSSGL